MLLLLPGQIDLQRCILYSWIILSLPLPPPPPSLFPFPPFLPLTLPLSLPPSLPPSLTPPTLPLYRFIPTLSNFPKIFLIAPTLFLALLAIVVLLGERWLGGPYVNTPLDVPPAVSNEWRNESVYRTRLWGTYRWAELTFIIFGGAAIIMN